MRRVSVHAQTVHVHEQKGCFQVGVAADLTEVIQSCLSELDVGFDPRLTLPTMET